MALYEGSTLTNHMEKTIKFSPRTNNTTSGMTNNKFSSNYETTKIVSINSKNGMSEKEAYQWILSNNKKQY